MTTTNTATIPTTKTRLLTIYSPGLGGMAYCLTVLSVNALDLAILLWASAMPPPGTGLDVGVGVDVDACLAEIEATVVQAVRDHLAAS